MPFGIGHPPPTHQISLYVWRWVQGSQIFKQNSIISIRSKVIAFLVISLSPCGPHVILTLSPSSPCCPRHPHIIPIIPIALRRSLCGPHGCILHCLHPMLSPWSHGPRSPHVVPIIRMSSPCWLEGPHIIPNPPESTQPTPTPVGVGDLESVRNAIRYELIKIF